MDEFDIHPAYGVPRETICCPGCGKSYATRRVCVQCQQCVMCCSCEQPDLIPGKDMIAKIIADG